jgi:hypothetical protein
MFEQKHITKVVLHLPESVTPQLVTMLKQKSKPGTIPVELHFTEQQKRFFLQAHHKIMVTEEFLKELKEYNILAHVHM